MNQGEDMQLDPEQSSPASQGSPLTRKQLEVYAQHWRPAYAAMHLHSPC
ncbi:hypothetical protein [Thermostichus vulcanus]|uniref:Uncharacterized protein n=1 Tax=Thermostichus vulcanus str. 'Rupite' TaxID=2813851 RepID=A0ABT0C925_THEVL|nr:hypothetical protein [Thermostichus vulcanus]MCJ2542293.1 hypothetical protein [Thermostichus vulcanus str. 'Rupite']